MQMIQGYQTKRQKIKKIDMKVLEKIAMHKNQS